MDDLISCARLEAVGLGVDAFRVDSQGASREVQLRELEQQPGVERRLEGG